MKRQLAPLAILTVCVVSALPAFAGPPLLCPPTVLTAAEREFLMEQRERDAESAVSALIANLKESNDARWHVESVRFFATRNRAALPLLTKTLTRVAGTSATTPQGHLLAFDSALAQFISDYDSTGSYRHIQTMAQIADQHPAPALALAVSEALDLATFETDFGHRHAYLFSQLALRYFEKALTLARHDQTPQAPLNRELVASHYKSIQNIHRGDPAWAGLTAQVNEIAK